MSDDHVPKPSRLRRLSDDTPWLQKRLSLLDTWLTSKEIEPFDATVMAEWLRRQSKTFTLGNEPSNPPLPTMADMTDLWVEPGMAEILKSQADGPWEVYFAQAQGAKSFHSSGASLEDLHRSAADMSDEIESREVGAANPQHQTYRYDVAISCAGADRSFVQKVVQILQRSGIRTYYDDNESNHVDMLGRDLSAEIVKIYESEAASCVVFLSQAYAAGRWTQAELRAVMKRATASPGYVKPIRLDDTDFQDIPKSLVFLDARPGRPLSDPTYLAEILLRALRKQSGANNIVGLAGSEADIEQIHQYFETVLPSMLRRYKEKAAAISATLQYSITAPMNEDWLVTLGPPDPNVTKLNLLENSDVRVSPRHMRIQITAREMIKMLTKGFDAREALIAGNVQLTGDTSLLKEIGAFFQNPQ
ncbi:toll/interleukin-1 receptor domain-containing protein [Bradyrhizobium sp. WSM 1704]|uniref:toll/interleukin-1 receptor domain-containing protein n=1 Tax=Bradyrhizobium semiaridum TaxID=2821404 RepID=UPI001CE35867|nr:toll/interleukin-1 receptor domain-containing protein [Bradyrhizobium semiaridum]MCA6122107.1 toll/interleukin-1 receptor domain-containing protein [Bradyrhizobium semiaridum]